MAIKLLEIDLEEDVKTIVLLNIYAQYRILIRIKTQPVGWITVPVSGNEILTPKKLHYFIHHQISWQVIQQSLAGFLANKNNTPCDEEYVSVVVCTRNRTEHLANCLSALFNLKYKNYEIIVVDNAPENDETFRLTQNLNVRYVCEDKPGLDKARNRGIQEARYNIIAFTDDDVSVDRYWLQSISKAFAHTEVMAVTGYVAPAELDTTAQCIFELEYGGMGQGFNRRIIRYQHLSKQELIWASNFGIGANMSFRRDLFNKTGNFDVALDVGTPSGGGGDIEMFHRLVNNGFTLVYDPSVLVWHTHRKNIPELKKQIFNNGKSFGCYLITCVHKKSIKRSTAIKFVLLNWLYKWNLKNMLKSTIPKQLSLVELYGMISSPAAYRKSQAYAKRWLF